MEWKDILITISCIVNSVGLIAMYIDHTDHEVNSIVQKLRVWAVDHFQSLPNSYKIDVDYDWHPRVLKPSYRINITVTYDYGDGKWVYYPFGKDVSFIFGWKAKKFKEKVLKSDVKQLCIDAYNNYIESTFNSIEG
jgi:hypothetical protein